MGAAVSNWRLAQAVSKTGQLGVVSGTALDAVLARRLQDGDPGGEMRFALDHFPFPEMAARVRERYFLEGGRKPGQSYKANLMLVMDPDREMVELSVVANFVEVFLAKQGHSNPVGVNYLEKIQVAHLTAIYGAMLAGVDFVLMGAGIPLRIPGVLDKYVNHEAATYPIGITGAQDGDDNVMKFNPRDYMERELGPLHRPKFLAIIASNTLAVTMVRKANGRVDGFVVEGPTAGGHNAPPRGKLQLSDEGEPVYGDRDKVDLSKLAELGLPFWLAGGYGNPEKLQEALANGAAGIQVGTAFAFSEESGFTSEFKRSILERVAEGKAGVFTDPIASPTGFPFKVARMEGTISEADVYAKRPRICDLGYLREVYRTPEGAPGYRCSSEPVTLFVSKGGEVEETVGRKCLCNGLLANIGLAQTRAGGKHTEQGLITSGDDLPSLKVLLPGNGAAPTYRAADVIRYLLGA